MIAVSLSFPYEDTMVSRRGNGRFSTGILAFLYEETVVCFNVKKKNHNEETVVSLLETEISLTCPSYTLLYNCRNTHFE